MARGRTYRRRKADGTWSRWYAVIDAPRERDASRRQVTRTFDTQREAHVWLAEQSAGNAGRAGNDSGHLVSTWMKAWLGQQPFTKTSTLATYRCHVERHILPALGTMGLLDLSRSDVQDFVVSLSESGLAPGTVRRVVATLQSALGAACREGLVEANAVSGVRLPAIPARPHTVWDERQAGTFLSHCPDTGEGVLFRLALMTGMRRGELLGLTWSAVDLDASALVVRASRVAVGSQVVSGPPKSRFGVRRIYLDAQTVSALRRWRLLQQPGGPSGEQLVFTHSDGAPFEPWWVSRAFVRVVRGLGLPLIRFHDLRHTSASLGLALGESLKEVSARLGHADIGITANVYGEVLPDTARLSAARRAAAVAQAAPSLRVVAS